MYKNSDSDSDDGSNSDSGGDQQTGGDFGEDSGQWIGGEFYAQSHKRKRPQSKADVIYGVFADDDDDDDDDGNESYEDILTGENTGSRVKRANNRGGRPRKNGGRGGGGARQSGHPAKPVSFVSQSQSQRSKPAGDSASGSDIDAKAKRQTNDSSDADSDSDSDLPSDGGSDGDSDVGVDIAQDFSSMIKSASVKQRQKRQLSKSNDDFRKMLATAETNQTVDSEDQSRSAAETGIKPLPAPVLPAVSLKGLGAWEKHTKGIGMKLLQKFGFKGRLGANEDGIAQAVEVVVRPQGVGLGFGSQAKDTSGALDGANKSDKDKEGKDAKSGKRGKKGGITAMAMEDIAQSDSWKKGSKMSAKQKQKQRQMMKLEDFLDDGGENMNQFQTQVIIDMRGPSAAANANIAEGTTVSSHLEPPKLGEELLYNVDMVASVVDNRINNLSRKLNTCKRLHDEQASAAVSQRTAVDQDTSRLQSLTEILAILDKVEAKLETAPEAVTLPGICQLYKTLFANYSEEFKLFGLLHTFPGLTATVLRSQLKHWRPLGSDCDSSKDTIEDTNSDTVAASSGRLLLDVTAAWLPLTASFRALGEDQLADEVRTQLHRTLEQEILPIVRRAITNDWDPRLRPKPCLALCQVLQTVMAASASSSLSTSSFDMLLDTVVMPKLTQAVDTWKPTFGAFHSNSNNNSNAADNNDTSIHSYTSVNFTCNADLDSGRWLLPWVPFFGERLSALYPEVRRKLHKLFQQHWKPPSSFHSDPLMAAWQCDIARQALQPWFGVFDGSAMETLVVKSVVPALAMAARTGVIVDPSQQRLECFDAVMRWTGHVPTVHFVSLWEVEFFPRWLGCLRDWLSQSADSSDGEGVVEEVMAWYKGWKTMFPGALGEDPAVLLAFSVALEMIKCTLAFDDDDDISEEKGGSLHSQLHAFVGDYCKGRESYATVVERRLLLASQQKQSQNQTQNQARSRYTGVASGGLSSFKEVVEAFAESHGVDFYPRPGKSQDGKQVWMFGSCPCYLDQEVAFVQRKASAQAHLQWMPIDLDGLLQMAK